MIRDGYYYPDEVYRDLNKLTDEGKIEGQAQVAICSGNRSAGKTVGHCISALQNYERSKERFMILARNDKQLNAGYLKAWFNKTFPLNDKDGYLEYFRQQHQIEVGKKTIKIDGDILCYCEAISMSKDVKDQGSYDTCTRIIMDEAYQEGETTLNILGRSAMKRIFEIWDTVARGFPKAKERTNLVFLSNVATRDNWIYNDLHINDFLRKDTKYTCQRGIVCEIMENKCVENEMNKTFMAEIMKNSKSGLEYYEMAHHNMFNDNEAFIKKQGLDFSKLKIQLYSRDAYLGVFYDDNIKKYHIAKIKRDERSQILCNDIKKYNNDFIYENYGSMEQTLFQSFTAGLITFQTLEAKNMFLEFCHII